MATILLALIYLIFISLGLPDSLLGAAWPAAYQTLGVPVSYAGFISICITAGTVISSLFAVTVVRRFGAGRVTAASVLLTAAAMLGFSFGQSYLALCLLALPLGLGAGSIDAVLNNYVANHYNAVQMNLLHAFWGVGATCGPLIIAAFLQRGNDWHGGYRAVSLIQFGIAALTVCLLPLWRRIGAAPDDANSQTDERTLGNKAALHTPGVPLAMLGFFFYCATEMSMGLWAATYYVKARGVAAGTAANYGALFFAGMMAGRVVSGFASIKLKERTLIYIGMLLAALGAGCMLFLPMPYAVAGLLLVGVGCAPIFPNMLQLTPYRFGTAASQAAMGLQMAAAYIGSTVMPPLIGMLCQRFGFVLLPWFSFACLIVLAAILHALNRYAAGAKEHITRQ